MPAEPKQRSTEHYGQGQSGYTAGRDEGDPSLGLEGRNVSYVRGWDGEEDETFPLGTDERFAGRGGQPWVREETESAKSAKG